MTQDIEERRRANELATSTAHSIEEYDPDADEPIAQHLGAIEWSGEISASGKLNEGVLLTQTGGPRVEVRAYEAKVRVYTGSVEAWDRIEDCAGLDALRSEMRAAFGGLEVDA